MARLSPKLDFEAKNGKEHMERKPAVYTLVHEDLSTGETNRFPSKSQLRAKSTSKKDGLIFKALNRAIEADKLRIYLDYGKINRPGSPIYNPWECLLPILVPIVVGLLFIMFVGVFFGLVFIVSMILIYSAWFKKKFYRYVIERTKNHIASNIENCQELWDFGGLVFVNNDDKKLGCVSPEGDWKDFVVVNFAEFMTEKKQEENKQEKKEEPRRERRRRQ